MSKNFERITLTAVIIILILVSVADLLGLTDHFNWLSDRIPAMTLLLITLVAGFWISEQRNERDQLNRIEKLASLSGVGIRTFESTKEAMGYLARRFTETQNSIDQVATAPSLAPSYAYSEYDQVLKKVLNKNVVKYRHIVVIDATRWNRVKAFLLDPNIQRYYVSYYERQQGGVPGFSYAIIDESEIVMRYPYSPDQPELWLSTRHPEIVRLFVAYSRSLWSQGTRLEAANISQIEAFDHQYSAA